jgi:hypothetical protein
VIFLNGLDSVTVLLQGGDAQGGGAGPAQRRHDARAGIDGGGADFYLVGARRLAGGFDALQKTADGSPFKK